MFRLPMTFLIFTIHQCKRVRFFFSVVFVALIFLFSFCTACRGEEYWRQQRGSEAGVASVIYNGNTMLREWHFKGKGKRRYEQGITVWASPVIAVVDDVPMAFIGGCDNILYALDLADKSVRWAKMTNGSIQDAPVIGEVNGMKIVFWCSSDRFVYAHIAANGERLWTREMIQPTKTQGTAHMPSPLFHGGILYVTFFVYDKAVPSYAQKSFLAALNAETGRLLWQEEIDNGPLSAPIGAEIDGRFFVFIAARKGVLRAYAVDEKKVEGIWQVQMPHEVMASPAIETNSHSPRLFLGSKFGDLIAFDARTGKKLWHKMTGNWVDNNACVSKVNGENVVFVGSHDYSLYALRTSDGFVMWKKSLGGEVYSAPCVFRNRQNLYVAAACLDNHLYVLDAVSGKIETAYFTGEPVWDKISKGENLWGSPAAVETRNGAFLVHGSYNGYVYVLPVEGETSLRAKARNSLSLWISLAAAGIFFALFAIPIVLIWPNKHENSKEQR